MDHIPGNTGKLFVGCADFMTRKGFKPPSNVSRSKDFSQSKEVNKDLGPEDEKTVESNINNNSNTPGYFFRLFYPTSPEAAKNHERDHWIPSPHHIYAQGFTFFMHLPVFLFSGLTRWILGKQFYTCFFFDFTCACLVWEVEEGITCHTRMHAHLDAPLYQPQSEQSGTDDDNNVKTSDGCLPVVVFSHGLGANRTCYSAFCADLASRGFLVASVEHRDKSASATYYIEDNSTEVYVPYRRLAKEDDEFMLRNSQVDQRAHEVSSVLTILEMLNDSGTASEMINQNVVKSKFDFSSLKGILDLENVSVVGHSFGGATALNTLSKDKRFKFGVVFDAWMFPLGEEVYKNTEQPVLLINSETFHWEKNIEQINGFIGKDENKKVLTIKGTGHHSQCDIPSIVPSWMLKIFKMHASLKQDTAMRIQRKVMFAFIREHLGTKHPRFCEVDDDENEAAWLEDYITHTAFPKSDASDVIR
eukprot:gene11923-13158_t